MNVTFGAFRVPVLSDAFEDLTDGIKSIIEDIPGAEWVAGIAKDIADNDFGQILLRAIAGSLYGPLAWQIGPQLAAVTWALPGLVRGESFDQAWVKEFAWRLSKVAEALGPIAGEVVGAELNEYLEKAGTELLAKAKEAFGDLPTEQFQEALKNMPVDPGELARRLDIRPDVAAYTVALKNRSLDQLQWAKDHYDFATGQLFKTFGRTTARDPLLPPPTACESLATAKAAGLSPNVVAILQVKCDAERSRAQAYTVTHQTLDDLRRRGQIVAPSVYSPFRTVDQLRRGVIMSTVAPPANIPAAPSSPPPAAIIGPEVTDLLRKQALTQTLAVKAARPAGDEVTATPGSAAIPILVGGGLIAAGFVWWKWFR